MVMEKEQWVTMERKWPSGDGEGTVGGDGEGIVDGDGEGTVGGDGKEVAGW